MLDQGNCRKKTENVLPAHSTDLFPRISPTPTYSESLSLLLLSQLHQQCFCPFLAFAFVQTGDVGPTVYLRIPCRSSPRLHLRNFKEWLNPTFCILPAPGFFAETTLLPVVEQSIYRSRKWFQNQLSSL